MISSPKVVRKRSRIIKLLITGERVSSAALVVEYLEKEVVPGVDFLVAEVGRDYALQPNSRTPVVLARSPWQSAHVRSCAFHPGHNFVLTVEHIYSGDSHELELINLM